MSQPIDPSARRRGGHRAYRAAALALALMFSVGACSDDDGPTAIQDQVDLTLSDTSVTMIRGQTNTRQITATVSGTPNTALTWTVGNSAIATVSQTGLVTAVADGQTFVTATSTSDPSLNRSVVINVVSTVVTVSPPGGTFSFVGGPTRQLSVRVENNVDTTVTWRSSNPAVATVSNTGVVTPVAAGTATIIAQSVADPAKESGVTFAVDPAPQTGFTALTSGTAVSVAGTTGDLKRYYIEVPAGATNLVVTMTGANGDADLYVYSGNTTLANLTGLAGTAGGLVCAPFAAGSTETCTIPNPQPRIYYVLIDAYETYTAATLTATITRP